MLPYLRSEIHRLRRRRMIHVLLILMVVIPVAIYAIQWFTIQQQLDAIRAGRLPAGSPVNDASVRRLLDGLRPERAPEFALGLSSAVGAIFAVILAGSAMGNEFGWATVRTILAHGGRRTAFLFGKLGALAIAAVAIMLVGHFATFAAAYAVSIPGALDLSLSEDIAVREAGYFVRGLYVTLPYVAFAVMAAVMARSAAAGIGFGLVLFFGENILSGLAVQLNPDLRQVFDAGIARNLQTIVRTPPTLPPPGFRMPSATELTFAAAILAVWTVAFVSIAVHRFAKRDLTLA